MEEEETLSDHRYIRFQVSDPSLGAMPSMGRGGYSTAPRGWGLKKLDRDLMMAAATVKKWTEEATRPIEDADEGAVRLRGILSEICDASMPHRRALPPKWSVYWWTSELAELRTVCNRARRQYTHCRRRRDGTQMAAPLREAYHTAKNSMQMAIRAAKAKAWAELVDTIDRDPWDRPYKIVRKRLSAGGPPITEGMDPQVLEQVVSTLFPGDPGNVEVNFQPPEDEYVQEPEVRGVEEDELGPIIRKIQREKTAPGPDGIPAKILALTAGVTVELLVRQMNVCLRRGKFPQTWKCARMVLLPKEGKTPGTPSAYRPICLLDEAGKLFERIIVSRLRHLSREGPDLAECQFGSREGLSTIDAIMRVRTFVEEATDKGKVVVVVSLDIANAFNTLPWECVLGALRYHRVPGYIQDVIRDYFRDRKLTYPGRYGRIMRREARRGVPQGSVLGPLLWNLGYDWVLRGALLPGPWCAMPTITGPVAGRRLEQHHPAC